MLTPARLAEALNPNIPEGTVSWKKTNRRHTVDSQQSLLLLNWYGGNGGGSSRFRASSKWGCRFVNNNNTNKSTN